MTPRERLYAAVRGHPGDRVPVTPIFMAWAAHYVRRTYQEFYLNGDILAEAQVAVTRAFHVDQVSAISDPWREASAYGMEFDYPDEGVGIPKTPLIGSTEDLARLGPLDIDAAPRLADRVRGIEKMAAELSQTHSVLGWVEGPIAEYADLRGLQEAMIDLIDRPEIFRRTADMLVANAATFARAQIAAGADMIGVGDAAVSLIGPELYARHVFAWEKHLVESIHEAGAAVKLHICGNTAGIIGQMAATGADIIDVDWMVPLGHARQAVGPDVALCGNFDPAAVLLRGSADDVAAAARQCIADGGDRFILMPGCEVPPGTPEQNLCAFCPCDGCLIEDALRL